MVDCVIFYYFAVKTSFLSVKTVNEYILFSKISISENTISQTMAPDILISGCIACEFYALLFL